MSPSQHREPPHWTKDAPLTEQGRRAELQNSSRDLRDQLGCFVVLLLFRCCAKGASKGPAKNTIDDAF